MQDSGRPDNDMATKRLQLHDATDAQLQAARAGLIQELLDEVAKRRDGIDYNARLAALGYHVELIDAELRARHEA